MSLVPQKRKTSTQEKYQCPICGNLDPTYIGIRNNHPYCRRCISFRGLEASEDYQICDKADYFLNYELTKEQKILSDRLVDNYRHKINSLVKAVCGSGKTEIVFAVISYALKNKHRVGFTVPRRDVIAELYLRFKEVFKNNKVAVLYGGHTSIIEADLICLTTHQLFRYDQYFDLLIIDEIDAFPYHDNEVLEAFFQRAVKGTYIMLSATPSEKVLKKFQKKGMALLELNKRFHGYPLPVPEVIIRKSFLQYFELIKQLKDFVSRSKPVFIFCPTIDMCEETFSFINKFISGGNYVHSKKSDRSEVIEDFRKGKYKFLVTTAVLERGVTIKGLQVIIFHADNVIYDSHALIQISGRVGRKKESPTGKVIYICGEITPEINKSIKEIKHANESL